MRVAIFTETFLPKIDGVVTILCQALERLHERGHAVLLFGPPDMPAEYANAQLFRTDGPRFPLYPEIRISMPHPRIARALAAFNPDVVHALNPAFLGPTGITLARVRRIPLVASTHMDISSYVRHFAGEWGIPITWAYFRLWHNRADLNLAPSTFTLAQVRRHGFERVRWWQRGIDTTRFRPELRSDAMRHRLSDGHQNDLIALYVGRLSREKRVHLLRDTVCGIPGVRLALVGGGPDEADIRRTFAGTDAVFTGILRGDDLVAAYASADVLVFPSITETFGLAPLEAMACGLPVIASMSGGLVDTLRDNENALVYDAAQPHQIAQILRAIQASPTRRSALAAGALAYARTRTWQRTMDQLIDYYELARRVNRLRRPISRALTRYVDEVRR